MGRTRTDPKTWDGPDAGACRVLGSVPGISVAVVMLLCWGCVDALRGLWRGKDVAFEIKDE